MLLPSYLPASREESERLAKRILLSYREAAHPNAPRGVVDADTALRRKTLMAYEAQENGHSHRTLPYSLGDLEAQPAFGGVDVWHQTPDDGIEALALKDRHGRFVALARFTVPPQTVATMVNTMAERGRDNQFFAIMGRICREGLRLDQKMRNQAQEMHMEMPKSVLFMIPAAPGDMAEGRISSAPDAGSTLTRIAPRALFGHRGEELLERTRAFNQAVPDLHWAYEEDFQKDGMRRAAAWRALARANALGAPGLTAASAVRSAAEAGRDLIR